MAGDRRIVVNECNPCGGTGVRNNGMCSECGGHGNVKVTQKLIPSSVQRYDDAIAKAAEVKAKAKAEAKAKADAKPKPKAEAKAKADAKAKPKPKAK